MGIDGLLRQLKDAVLETHLRRYHGQTVVVDAFSWLHKACYGCAFELATGKETDAYVRYMLRKVDLLRSCGVGDVILVFDGDRLPLKASTHTKRSDGKKENRELAFQSMADAQRLNGAARQDEISKAYSHFQRAVSITPEVVTTVMQALRQANVRFVVAPFEADAQMVWMCKAGLASAIVTEDSDVLVYCLAANVDCHVLFKMDDGGMAQALSRKILHEHTATTDNAFLKRVHHLTTGDKEATRMFVQFCALAGCDFLASLPYMGVVTALKHVFSFRGAPGPLRVQRLLSKLSSSGTKVPPNFYKQFQQTESIFFHHIIFNSIEQTCEFLVDDVHAHCHPDVFARVKESLGITTTNACLHSLAKVPTTSFLGTVPQREIMIAVFSGEVCSRTKKRLSTPCRTNNAEEPTQNESIAHEDDTVDQDVDVFVPGPLLRRVPPGRNPIADPAVEERKLVQRAQQRDATMRSLLNTYDPTGALAASSQKAEIRSDPSIELVKSVHNAPIRQLVGPTRSTGSISAPLATVFTMKELAQRHTRVTNTGPVRSTITKTPESGKKRKLSTSSVPGSSKKLPGSNVKTLFNFFRKK